jgi:hypothetical protein
VLWGVAASGACAVVGGLVGGCNLINPPQPEPTLVPPPTPRPDLFDPADGLAPMAKLNDEAAPAGQLPSKFRVVNIPSGEVLQLQSLSGPAERRVPGTSDFYRLAGIVTPAPGRPGFAETTALIGRWTLGQEVDVEQDPRFPVDLDGRRMVQVYYTARDGALKGQRLLLNRMLVRLGYAMVDIHAPTTANIQAWLNDEAFAREKRLGLAKLGITIAQRPPLNPNQAVPRTTGERGAPRGRRPGGPPGITTTTSSTTSTSTVPGGSNNGAPGAGGPPPGMGGPPPGGASNAAFGGSSNSAPGGASNSAPGGASNGAPGGASNGAP